MVEIGMRNIRFDRIEDYNDIDTINRYKRVNPDWDRYGIYGRNPLVKDNTWINGGRRKDPTSILNYFRK